MGGIIHVVQLQFKSNVGSEKIDEVIAQLKALKDRCVLPDTQKTSIISIKAGADNSIEGVQNGYTHMIITEFESVAHRDYYAKNRSATVGSYDPRRDIVSSITSGLTSNTVTFAS